MSYGVCWNFFYFPNKLIKNDANLKKNSLPGNLKCNMKNDFITKSK